MNYRDKEAVRQNGYHNWVFARNTVFQINAGHIFFVMLVITAIIWPVCYHK